MPDFKFQSDAAIPAQVSLQQKVPVPARHGRGFAQFMASPESTLKTVASHMRAPKLADAATDGNEFAAGQSEASEGTLADSAMDVIAFQGQQLVSVIPVAAGRALADAAGPDTEMQSRIVVPEMVTHASGAKLQISEEIAARGAFVRWHSLTMPAGQWHMAEVAASPDQQATPASTGPRATIEALGLAPNAPPFQAPAVVAQDGRSRADLVSDKAARQAGAHAGVHLLMAVQNQGKQAFAGAALAALPAAHTAALKMPFAQTTSDRMQRNAGMVVATPEHRFTAVTPTALIELQLIKGGIAPLPQSDAAPEFRNAMAELGDGVTASLLSGGGGVSASGFSPGAAPSATTPGTVTLQIAQAFVQAHGDSFEVSLSPEELGRVRIQMHASETGLHVLITTERPETLDFLRKNIAFLSRDLSGLGFNSTSFEFAGGSSDRDQGQSSAGAANFSRSAPPSAANLSGVQATMSPMSGAGLDLRF